MKLVEYTRFYSEDGELLGEEVNIDSCNPYLTSPCGGCYNCMMAQVAHYGCDLIQVWGMKYI